MVKKKGLSARDAQPSKAVSNIDGASNSATAFQSQIKYLARRFGLSAARAAALAPLAFGEARP